ncbi:hypothetical protein V2W45_643787 [Cenococcum geophilum]
MLPPGLPAAVLWPPRPSAPSTRSTLLPTALRLASRLTWLIRLTWAGSAPSQTSQQPASLHAIGEHSQNARGVVTQLRARGVWQRVRPLARGLLPQRKRQEPCWESRTSNGSKGWWLKSAVEEDRTAQEHPSTHGGRRPYYRPSREAPIKLGAKNPFSRMRPGGLQPKGGRKKQRPIPDPDEAAHPSDTRRLIATAPPRHLQALPSTSQALWGATLEDNGNS